MALTPTNEIHALQIQAGVIGRKAGHAFEDAIASEINAFSYPAQFSKVTRHVSTGSPGEALLGYVASVYGSSQILNAVALSTGALATSEDGKKWLEVNGFAVKRCKSDIILTVRFDDYPAEVTLGISIKQCKNNKPLNAQVFLTTATGFANLLKGNDIHVSSTAVAALRQFCGDVGYRPLDDTIVMRKRLTDPRRFYWEEIEPDGRAEWETLFCENQDEITRLLLQKAYLDDPFSPDLVLHKTKKTLAQCKVETAIYTINELVAYSAAYGGFSTQLYSARGKSFKEPTGSKHEAPRFGVVQMQRFGNKQNFSQLQFNLMAGYFYKITQERP